MGANYKLILVLQYINGDFDLSMEDESDDTESEPESDMDILLNNLKDPINRLFKLSVWIRNPATRFASSKALQYQQIDEETNTDLFKVFEDFDYDYISSLFLQYRKHVAMQEKPAFPHTKEKEKESDEGYITDDVWEPLREVLLQHRKDIISGTESFLVRRIAQANVYRRRQFAYWKRHREKLEQHTTAILQHPLTRNLVEAPVHISRGIIFDHIDPLSEGPAQSITTASRLNVPQRPINEAVSTGSVSEYSPSAWQPSKDTVNFPPPPSVSNTEEFFECPYCFTICSTALLREKAWK
jgi:hypothetical protein